MAEGNTISDDFHQSILHENKVNIYLDLSLFFDNARPLNIINTDLAIFLLPLELHLEVHIRHPLTHELLSLIRSIVCEATSFQ